MNRLTNAERPLVPETPLASRSVEDLLAAAEARLREAEARTEAAQYRAEAIIEGRSISLTDVNRVVAYRQTEGSRRATFDSDSGGAVALSGSEALVSQAVPSRWAGLLPGRTPAHETATPEEPAPLKRPRRPMSAAAKRAIWRLVALGAFLGMAGGAWYAWNWLTSAPTQLATPSAAQPTEAASTVGTSPQTAQASAAGAAVAKLTPSSDVLDAGASVELPSADAEASQGSIPVKSTLATPPQPIEAAHPSASVGPVTPAPTAASPVAPPVVDPEADAAAIIAKQFFSNGDPQSWRPWVRHPDLTLARAKFWQTSGQMPAFQPQSVPTASSFKRVANGFAAEVSTESGLSRPLVVLKTKSGWRVDWEAMAGWSERPWDKLREERPIDPVLVRAVIEANTHFAGAFSDKVQWHSWKLTDGAGKHTFNAYSAVGSADSVALTQAAQKKQAVTLRVQYPENAASGDLVQISEVVSSSWSLPLSALDD